MLRTLEIQVQVSSLPLATDTTEALAQLDTYDWVLFASKHAVGFFAAALSKHSLTFPNGIRVAAVGPKTGAALQVHGFTVTATPSQHDALHMVDVLGTVDGARLLFPRSAIAPDEPVRILRDRGAHVTVLPLYATTVPPLATQVRTDLITGAYGQLLFKSTSGVEGFLTQFTAKERDVIQEIPASCIGPATAQAAKAAGFKKVSIKGIV